MKRVGRRTDEGRGHATMLELFYDLVFVFAITQVTHLLLDQLDWAGAGRASLVLLVVWWSWNYTTWVTNELDPESVVTRLLLIGLMLASLLMAIAIPDAFGDKALLFACSYVGMQIGRHTFLAFAAARPRTIERERAGRILTWFALAGMFWISGAFVDGSARVTLWIIALVVDYSAPLVLYWVPARPRLSGATWEVGTEHFAERFQLFIIVALGESIVITGATTSELDLNRPTILAFGVAFLISASLWWLYFSVVARIVQQHLEVAQDRTTVARDAYTYLHVVIVAGIILSAVGDELVIAHPTETLHGPELVAVVAGPALYLLAHVALRLRMTGTISVRRLTAAVACVAVGFIGPHVSALFLSTLLLGVLIAVIAAEQLAAARRNARGQPSPLEGLQAPAEEREA
ncbi:MAG: low temperature requirement protein A [Actinobacteria bacterium]|nr:low temperature requirement protein A [Actinomycetota bacterium]